MRMTLSMRALPRSLISLLVAWAFCAVAEDDASSQQVNVYSARHYDTDLRLYERFTEKTGIKVNLIEGNSDGLIERIVNEAEFSPADMLITVDAGRIWRAGPTRRVPECRLGRAERARARASARPRRPLVRPVEARSRHRLQQVEGLAGRHCPLRGSRRRTASRPGLHALFGQHLQPVAARFVDRAPRRRGRRAMGNRRRRQLSPFAPRQRPGPVAGRGRGANAA